MSAARPNTVTERRTLLAAIGAAVAASICCVGPLVLIALGASGAWMSRLTFLEPVRPLLILGTGGLLGYAWARVYAKPAQPEVCEPGSLCADPRTDRVNRIALWSVSILIAGLLMIPAVVGMLDRNTAAATPPPKASVETTAVAAVTGVQQVELAIENMTCAACPHNVRGALEAVEGAKVLSVTLDPPRAVVEYDSDKTSIEALTAATTDVGYPSKPANS